MSDGWVWLGSSFFFFEYSLSSDKSDLIFLFLFVLGDGVFGRGDFLAWSCMQFGFCMRMRDCGVDGCKAVEDFVERFVLLGSLIFSKV